MVSLILLIAELSNFRELRKLPRADGYVTRFGVTYVDYETQERYPKESAKFLVKVSRNSNQRMKLVGLLV